MTWQASVMSARSQMMWLLRYALLHDAARALSGADTAAHMLDTSDRRLATLACQQLALSTLKGHDVAQPSSDAQPVTASSAPATVGHVAQSEKSEPPQSVGVSTTRGGTLAYVTLPSLSATQQLLQRMRRLLSLPGHGITHATASGGAVKDAHPPASDAGGSLDASSDPAVFPSLWVLTQATDSLRAFAPVTTHADAASSVPSVVPSAAASRLPQPPAAALPVAMSLPPPPPNCLSATAAAITRTLRHIEKLVPQPHGASSAPPHHQPLQTLESAARDAIRRVAPHAPKRHWREVAREKRLAQATRSAGRQQSELAAARVVALVHHLFEHVLTAPRCGDGGTSSGFQGAWMPAARAAMNPGLQAQVVSDLAALARW